MSGIPQWKRRACKWCAAGWPRQGKLHTSLDGDEPCTAPTAEQEIARLNERVQQQDTELALIRSLYPHPTLPPPDPDPLEEFYQQEIASLTERLAEVDKKAASSRVREMLWRGMAAGLLNRMRNVKCSFGGDHSLADCSCDPHQRGDVVSPIWEVDATAFKVVTEVEARATAAESTLQEARKALSETSGNGWTVDMHIDEITKTAFEREGPAGDWSCCCGVCWRGRGDGIFLNLFDKLVFVCLTPAELAVLQADFDEWDKRANPDGYEPRRMERVADFCWLYFLESRL